MRVHQCPVGGSYKRSVIYGVLPRNDSAGREMGLRSATYTEALAKKKPGWSLNQVHTFKA